MPEDPDDWKQVDALLQEALDRPLEERERWLQEACAGNAALRDRVAELLHLAAAEDDGLTQGGALRAPGQGGVPEARALRPGDHLGRYEIRSLLGAGGMGRVYRALDPVLGREVAIKALGDALHTDSGSLRRFEREARLLARMSHPNIATIHGFELHDGAPYLILERVEGQTLEERLRSGPLPLAEALTIAVQVAEGLAEAHGKGVIHRDLKPANVMLTSSGRVKLLDFGLAKRADPGRVGDSVTMNPTTGAGEILGTAPYMSPEQIKDEDLDERTDVWAFGCLLYKMLAGSAAFGGRSVAETLAAVLRDDPDWSRLPRSTPPSILRLLHRCLRKDRQERLQHIGDARLELVESSAATTATGRQAEIAIAVLYFENLGGMKEDEYFRDGITEDIITELSRIKGLKIFPRPTVLTYRDKSVTPQQVGRELSASYVLGGSLRRAGNRLRINTQLMDARTDFPLWSERYDREMKDVFEVQDEIARKIAEALRITLSPQEQEALAARPTANHQAYDLYLNGRSYARRRTRQDLEYALHMFENAVRLDPDFALAHAAIANVCAQNYHHYHRDAVWTERAQAASRRAVAIQPELPEAQVARGWILYAEGRHDEAIQCCRQAIERKRDCEGAYYLLGRVLFAAGRYQEVADMADAALEAAGDDYNVYGPIENSLKALGRLEKFSDFLARRMLALENHVTHVPEDARARTTLAFAYIELGRPDDAVREVILATTLRPNDANVLYNAACVFCRMGRKEEALTALTKAWDAGYKDSVWARRDPDLGLLHGDPEFERMFPKPAPDS